MVGSDKQTTLVELGIAGDRDAFDALYRQWHTRWLRFALRHTDDAQVAQDVLQEAAVQMVRNLRRLRDPSTFVAWSFVILRRCCADHVRKAVRRRDARVQWLEQLPDPEPPADPRLVGLSVAVSELSPDQQNLLTLFYGYGLSIAELAAVYQVPAGTIKSRLFKMRETLRVNLSHSEESES